MVLCKMVLFKTDNATFLKDIIEVGSINFVHTRIYKKHGAVFHHITHRRNIKTGKLYRNEMDFYQDSTLLKSLYWKIWIFVSNVAMRVSCTSISS